MKLKGTFAQFDKSLPRPLIEPLGIVENIPRYAEIHGLIRTFIVHIWSKGSFHALGSVVDWH